MTSPRGVNFIDDRADICQCYSLMRHYMKKSQANDLLKSDLNCKTFLFFFEFNSARFNLPTSQNGDEPTSGGLPTTANQSTRRPTRCSLLIGQNGARETKITTKKVKSKEEIEAEK